jgi:hypothetical protein
MPERYTGRQPGQFEIRKLAESEGFEPLSNRLIYKSHFRARSLDTVGDTV